MNDNWLIIIYLVTMALLGAVVANFNKFAGLL